MLYFILSLIGAILALFTGFLAVLIYQSINYPDKDIAKIPAVPPAKLLHRLLVKRASPIEIYDEFKSYFDTKWKIGRKWMFGKWAVEVGTLEPAKFLFGKPDSALKTLTTELPKSTLFSEVWDNNIVFSNGNEWRRHRRVVNPAFHRSWSTEIFGSVTQTLLQQWSEIDSKPIPVPQWMQRFTLDALALMAFSLDFKSLQNENDERVQIYNEFMQVIINPFFMIVPFIKYLTFLPAVKSYRRSIAYLDKILFDLVDTRLAQWEERRKAGESFNPEQADLLDFMLMATQGTDKDQEPLTRKELRDDLLIFFIAGHDTTSNALSACLYFLATNPNVQDKAYEEVQRVIGAHQPLDYVPSFDEQKQFQYLSAVMKESMRRSPPLTKLPTRRLSDSMQVGPYVLPKGTLVDLNLYAVMHDPEQFPDPYVFNPNRFLDANGGPIDHPAFCAFGGGSRMCLGQQFSLIEQRVMLSMLLRTYRVSLPAGSIHRYALHYHPGELLTPKDLNLLFTKRH